MFDTYAARIHTLTNTALLQQLMSLCNSGALFSTTFQLVHANCKLHNSTVLRLVLVMLLLHGVGTSALGQCNGQDPLICDCDQTTSYSIAVCIAQTTAPITIKVCNQFPSPNLIRNPVHHAPSHWTP